MITISCPTHENIKTTQLLAMAERLFTESPDLTQVEIHRDTEHAGRRLVIKLSRKSYSTQVTEQWDIIKLPADTTVLLEEKRT